MNQIKTDEFKKLLLEKRDLLNKRLVVLESEDPFADPDRAQDNAAIDAEAAEQFGHERVVAMKDEIDEALKRIEQALTKIETGKYGICENCGNQILEERLKVDPAVRFCVTCQTNQTTTQE
jgi:RNA polymerase-binding protein DksA